MLEELKARVYKQNFELVKHGLVILTWGNVSARDEKTGLIVIKPSGVSYDTMTADDMVVTDIDGNVVEGNLRPSSDLPTHLYLYKAYSDIGGGVHTHSTYATAHAQAGIDIMAYGTTHADAFWGNIPCTRELTDAEINEAYEYNTGKVIVESINDPIAMPAAIVKNHGPFTFAKTPEQAVIYAVTLEEVAKMSFLTRQLSENTPLIKKSLSDKHYFRKHGKDAYYGQK